MKPGFVTLIGGLALTIPAAIGLLSTGVPTLLGPFPAMTAVPALFLSSRLFGIFIPPLAFFAWNPSLFRGESKLPPRSQVLLVVGAIFSVVWFALGWKNGLHYQGPSYVYKVCLANIASIILLVGVFVRSRKSGASFASNFAAHWLAFCWLAWFAFPYLGELP